MFGLEYLGTAAIAVKYFLLLLVGFKSYQILSSFLIQATDEELISQIIALLSAFVVIWLIREMFLVALIVVVVFLYFFGWIGRSYGFLKA